MTEFKHGFSVWLCFSFVVLLLWIYYISSITYLLFVLCCCIVSNGPSTIWCSGSLILWCEVIFPETMTKGAIQVRFTADWKYRFHVIFRFMFLVRILRITSASFAAAFFLFWNWHPFPPLIPWYQTFLHLNCNLAPLSCLLLCLLDWQWSFCYKCARFTGALVDGPVPVFTNHLCVKGQGVPAHNGTRLESITYHS